MNNNNDMDRKLMGRLQATIQMVQAWDADPMLLRECRAQIPIELLAANDSPYKADDDFLYRGNALFLKRLTLFFKRDVMKWVDKPDCSNCGSLSNQLESRGGRGPQTQEEREGAANRVEVYACTSCHGTTAFPRYNSVRKLLETRQGRCGEFANLFGLFCRASGFETRFIMDMTDHVWVEVWIPDGEQWIMADSCEGLIDKNSMYESGWGKKLSFNYGVFIDQMVDVSSRYTRQWNQPDHQARRREICSSEARCQQLIQQCNQQLHAGLNPRRLAELETRTRQEQVLLDSYKKLNEWTEEEKHGHGRISGSMAWKVSRQEAGNRQPENGDETKPPTSVVRSWDVEQFLPTSSPEKVTISVTSQPGGGYITVSGVQCDVGGGQTSTSGTVSIVVVDDACLGCILQSRVFDSWASAADFIWTLPKNRIVALKVFASKEEKADASMDAQEKFQRLGGFPVEATTKGVLYIGQVEAHPDWTISSTFEDSVVGIEVRLQNNAATNGANSLKLRTESGVVPRRVATRIPESSMPLQTQLLASEEQKRAAFLSFAKTDAGKKYIGYTTKPNCPVYLLDSSAFPFERIQSVSKDPLWTTFHFLPEVLVPESDNGAGVDSDDKPKFDIPLATQFFTDLFGPSLLVQPNGGGAPTKIETIKALHNSRLVALYFSAHWCGPCRRFTPMLAEMYAHLKEEFPHHGLEIVFVSSDRDPGSFNGYYSTMPWLAVPFDMSGIMQQIKMRYDVSGIPSFVVLDAISGQIVVFNKESKSEVMRACQTGKHGIEDQFESWLSRIPPDSIEITQMLKTSLEEDDDEQEKTAADSDGRKEYAYCVRDVAESNVPPTPVDPAARVKEIFTELVAKGSEPNAAAAKAIQMFAEEQKHPQSVTYSKGNLNDVVWKASKLDKEQAAKVVAGPTLEDCISRVKELNPNNDDAVTTITSTMLKYVDKAIKDPCNPKFRYFKLSNKIADRMTRVEGGLDLVIAYGFDCFSTSQDFMVSIPLAANLDAMKLQLEAKQE